MMQYVIYSDRQRIIALPDGEDLTDQDLDDGYSRLGSVEAESMDSALDQWVEDRKAAGFWSIA